MSKDRVMESLRAKLTQTNYYRGATEQGGYVSKGEEVKQAIQEKLHREKNAGEFERKREYIICRSKYRN